MRYIRGKDLNLLVVFAALWRERSVTKAALATGMTQPALSRSLARLRVEFSDQLFVRGARGVTPTARAVHLSKTIVPVVETLNAVYAPSDTFDPKKIAQVLTIAASDYFETIAATTLIPLLAKQAPGLTLNFRTGLGRIPKEAMETGDIDLMVGGIFEHLPEGFYRQKLFTDHYRSAVRQKHPQKKFSAELFAASSHVLVTPRGDLTGIVDSSLAKLGKQRRIALGVTNFLSAGWMITHTDHVLSAPSKIIENLKGFLPLRDFATPIAIPPLDMFQVWHARSNKDPVQMWVRQAIKDCLAK